MKIVNIRIFVGLLIFSCLIGCNSSVKQVVEDDTPRRIELLFLGHSIKHHNSRAYFPILASALTKDGINITYTENVDDLNTKNLALYDGVIVYANHEGRHPDQEKALMDYVADGHAFIPLHCASFCFKDSPEYVDLVGGQFSSHGTGTFTTSIIAKDHPVMNDVSEFTTWDETYVHDKIADDITVLMERVEGEHREPWTWVKQYGEGKVFYTAYGHDERTWENPGFQNLVKQGILWAVNDNVKNNWLEFSKNIPELVYEEREGIPNYEKRDPPLDYQLPLSPEESAKLIQVPAGFDLALFASEPDIINPIAMNWDEKGRLWVIETVDYPNTVRDDKGSGDDRIKILEDTDGDGRADKVTVFADNLNIPTSFTFVNGGIIVSQAPTFLFLKDTDGDDRADIKETIIDGWGTFDTHAGPSNLQYGIDNRIYGVLGYSGFEGTIFGEDHKFRQGLYRFNTAFNNFEFLTSTSNNTWGLGFTEDNSIFASTANNTHSVFMGIPNANFMDVEGISVQGSLKIDGHYDMQPITRNYRQVDVFGGFTAAAGHHFYTAREYPSSYWNKVAFVCEPTGGIVHIAKIKREGAGYLEEDGGNLFAGSDEWVSPVEAKVGPDGAVWVADWYNFIVQHNPTPKVDRGGFDAENGLGNAYVNPLRDKAHGRIWRVVPKSQKKHDGLFLSKEDPDKLVEALSHNNLFWRLTAQRLLIERANDDVLTQLYTLVNDPSMNALGQNPSALHALWTMEGLGAIPANQEATAVVRGALFHPTAAIRKAAIQILPKTMEVDGAIQLSGVLHDSDARVQLAALLYFSERNPSDEIGKTLYGLSQDKKVRHDKWLSQAVYIASSKHIKGFIEAFQKDHPNFKAKRVVSIDSELPVLKGEELAETFVTNYIDKVGSGNDMSSDILETGVVINIGTVTNELKYNISEFVVEAGKPVSINFENSDFMQHNIVIVQKGQKEKVGAAADKMAADPTAAEKNYVPEMAEVLFATAIVNPEESVTLQFMAPSEPGEYPFICTFPGHWRIMQGVMKVVE